MKHNRKPNNVAVRNALTEHGLFTYSLEDILGVSETTVTRMMRHELPKEEQDRIIKLIEEGDYGKL